MSSISFGHYYIGAVHWAENEVCYDTDQLNKSSYESLGSEAADDWNSAIDTSDFQFKAEGFFDCDNDMFFSDLSADEAATGQDILGQAQCYKYSGTQEFAECNIAFDSQDT